VDEKAKLGIAEPLDEMSENEIQKIRKDESNHI
jgi:hypothetical protein